MITHEELVQILHYDPETGIFTWAIPRPKIRVGQIAGSKNKKGRTVIEIKGKQYFASRLAYFYMVKKWPIGQIDHINCIKHDDRWCNLRDSTQSQNQANRKVLKDSKVPFKGVTIKHRLPKPYVAQISKDGKVYHLGCFSTPEEAHSAYCNAAQKLHGDYWRG
jgi:hypothetical protein